MNLRVFDELMGLTKARGGLGGGALVVAASGNESQRQQHPEWRIAQNPHSMKMFGAFGDACRARHAQRMALLANQ